MGKELLFKVLRHEVLEDEDKLYESLMEVRKLYEPDGMPIMFDLQIEAEILGCKLLWADYNPPSVRRHPYVKGGPQTPISIRS